MDHIRAHSNLSGPSAEGDALADKLSQSVPLSRVEVTQQLHILHQQNNKN